MANPTATGIVTSTSGYIPTMPPQITPYTAPSSQPFNGTLPTASPYGNFTGPNPADVSSDPYYQFRAAEGAKAIQASAAAHGTLLNGGTLKALEGYRQGLASEEAGKAFDRALQAYTANRDTAAQNFGEQNTIYGDQIGGYNANTNAALGYGRLGLDANQSNYDQARQGWMDTNAVNAAYAQQNYANNANAQRVQQGIDDRYAQQVADTRRQNEETAAMSGRLPSAPRATEFR